jgi:hypothetical protein
VEAAHEQIAKTKGGDPTFKRWRGDARIGVQIQHGLAAADLCDNRHIRIDDLSGEKPAPDVRPGKTTARIRVGTNPDRSPIFASFPMVLHRTLPPEGRIKSAWVSRRYCGRKPEWTLSLVVEAHPRPKPMGKGLVALDIGWRKRPSGLRVAYWYDETGNEGEITLPLAISDCLQRAESLQQFQSDSFNAARDALVNWCAANPLELPPWWGDDAANLSQWRSSRRMAQLVAKWRDWAIAEQRVLQDHIAPYIKRGREGEDRQPPSSDAELTEAIGRLESWRKQFWHLNEWEAHVRQKALRRRHDFYRCLANSLGTQYGGVVLEEFDLSRVQRKEAPESDKSPLHLAARYQQRVAGLSILRQCLKERMPTATVPAHNTTDTCADCGSPIPAGEDLMMTCPSCRRVWDQDANAARNILHRHKTSADTSTPTRIPAPPAGKSGEEA